MGRLLIEVEYLDVPGTDVARDIKRIVLRELDVELGHPTIQLVRFLPGLSDRALTRLVELLDQDEGYCRDYAAPGPEMLEWARSIDGIRHGLGLPYRAGGPFEAELRAEEAATRAETLDDDIEGSNEGP